MLVGDRGIMGRSVVVSSTFLIGIYVTDFPIFDSGQICCHFDGCWDSCCATSIQLGLSARIFIVNQKHC